MDEKEIVNLSGIDIWLEPKKRRITRENVLVTLLILIIFSVLGWQIFLTVERGGKLKKSHKESAKLKKENQVLQAQLNQSRLETKECEQDVFVVWEAYVRRNELLVNILGGSRTVKEDIDYDNILLVADFKETEDCLGARTYKDIFR